MRERAPEIDVFIITPTSLLPSDFWQRRAERPTALFAAGLMSIDPNVRGARLFPTSLTKFQEIEALRAANLPVPGSMLLRPETILDENEWGPFIVVKPNRGRSGNGVRLLRTRDARWRDTSLLPSEHPWHGRELVAQRYIDTGPFPACYRVMTVLGKRVYCTLSTSTVETPPLDPDDFDEDGIPITANPKDRIRTLAYDRDVIGLGEEIHRKLTHTPVMGIDIIREHKSGTLYALELNSGGWTWHISSDYGIRQEMEDGLGRIKQFGAFDIIADAFIEATRRHAI